MWQMALMLLLMTNKINVQHSEIPFINFKKYPQSQEENL